MFLEIYREERDAAAEAAEGETQCHEFLRQILRPARNLASRIYVERTKRKRAKEEAAKKRKEQYRAHKNILLQPIPQVSPQEPQEPEELLELQELHESQELQELQELHESQELQELQATTSTERQWYEKMDPIKYEVEQDEDKFSDSIGRPYKESPLSIQSSDDDRRGYFGDEDDEDEGESVYW